MVLIINQESCIFNDENPLKYFQSEKGTQQENLICCFSFFFFFDLQVVFKCIKKSKTIKGMNHF